MARLLTWTLAVVTHQASSFVGMCVLSCDDSPWPCCLPNVYPQSKVSLRTKASPSQQRSTPHDQFMCPTRHRVQVSSKENGASYRVVLRLFCKVCHSRFSQHQREDLLLRMNEKPRNSGLHHTENGVYKTCEFAGNRFSGWTVKQKNALCWPTSDHRTQRKP